MRHARSFSCRCEKFWRSARTRVGNHDATIRLEFSKGKPRSVLKVIRTTGKEIFGAIEITLSSFMTIRTRDESSTIDYHWMNRVAVSGPFATRAAPLYNGRSSARPAKVRMKMARDKWSKIVNRWFKTIEMRWEASRDTNTCHLVALSTWSKKLETIFYTRTNEHCTI